METYAAPALFALLLWWWSTGAILWLVGLPRSSHPWSMAAVTLLLLPMAVWGLIASGANASPFGAYLAFAGAVGVWGWHEMTFLFGYVTGPNRRPCATGVTGLKRLLSASGTVIYHELALALTAALLVWLLWESPNQVGVWTFLVLWVMRLSAKLNVYFGVPNMTEEFLQPHLSYLTSYFRKGPVTPLFALAVTGGTVVVVLAALRAVDPATPLFETVGLVLAGTLLLLAVVEHWFLVLPLRDAALWRWALREAAPGSAPEGKGAVPLRLDVQGAVPRSESVHAEAPQTPVALLQRKISVAG
ncbi:putative photosynthetic complex assembly protein PuhE [Algihabitans albus]|uniref:putative photosynthetic complex assembly protein PuhE n=1 Tax=Algihabitans albus TaxID=2164067 RepID=UPI000E5CBA4C|nr:putative photosynthetic complex assembly protein PuhE [Algihabitans albus]